MKKEAQPRLGMAHMHANRQCGWTRPTIEPGVRRELAGRPNQRRSRRDTAREKETDINVPTAAKRLIQTLENVKYSRATTTTTKKTRRKSYEEITEDEDPIS